MSHGAPLVTIWFLGKSVNDTDVLRVMPVNGLLVCSKTVTSDTGRRQPLGPRHWTLGAALKLRLQALALYLTTT
jgi:hypothetical protein